MNASTPGGAFPSMRLHRILRGLMIGRDVAVIAMCRRANQTQVSRTQIEAMANGLLPPSRTN